MSIRNTNSTYGSLAKFFHWLIFALVFLMLIYGYFLDDIPKEYKPFAYNTHKLIGLSILFLMLARLCWTLINPKPQLPGTPSFWERCAERFVHYLLYIVVIAMPLSGWIGSAAAGKFPQLGGFIFTLPIAQSKDLAHQAFEWHEFLAFSILGLVAVHVLAALYHHFIRKDNVLRRMMPGGRAD
jgi:cytochrome b561